MALDAALLEILACPEDKGPLYYLADEDVLYNPRLRRVYDVRDDIPVMLIDEARTVDDAEHDAPPGPHRRRGHRPTVRCGRRRRWSARRAEPGSPPNDAARHAVAGMLAAATG